VLKTRVVSDLIYIPCSHFVFVFSDIIDTMSTPATDLLYGSLDALVGYPPLPNQDAWTNQLEQLLTCEDLTQQVETELLTGPSPVWPDQVDCDMNEEAVATNPPAIAAIATEYGYDIDEEVMALLCEETIVDIRMGLWRADRFLELKQRVVDLFDLYNSGYYNEVVYTAEQLVRDHHEYERVCDPQIHAMVEASRVFMHAGLQKTVCDQSLIVGL
jgi:hypothetical protein